MRLLLTAALAGLAGALGAGAAEAPAQLGADGLDLVGCSTRTLMFRDIYDLSLFEGEAGEMIVMDVLHDGKMPGGLPDDWPPKLAKTVSGEVISQIDGAFRLIKPESRVEIAYLASDDLSTMTVDGETAVSVPERTTYDAVRAMWLGDDPIDNGVKSDILEGRCGA